MSTSGAFEDPWGQPLSPPQHAPTATSVRWHPQCPSENQPKPLEENGVVPGGPEGKDEWFLWTWMRVKPCLSSPALLSLFLLFPSSLKGVHCSHIINRSARLPLPR